MRTGDDTAGFSIDHEPVQGLLRVRVWGFWGPDLAGQFTRAMREASARARAPYRALIEGSGLLPQRPEVQEAFREVMQSMKGPAAARVCVVLSNAITKLMFMRLIKETGASVWSIFTTEGAANEALTARV